MGEPIPLGVAPKASIPIVKFRSIGQRLVGGLVDVDQRQQQQWVNGKPEGLKFKPDGKPAMQLVLTLLVLEGTTAVRVDRDSGEITTLKPGEIVRWILTGYKWGQYIEARNGVGREMTGDLIAGTYATGSVDNGRGGRTKLATDADVAAVPREQIVGKDFDLVVRRPGPEHAQVIDECNAARVALNAQPVGVTTYDDPF